MPACHLGCSGTTYYDEGAMKHRGFTLLELVIVLALIGISSMIGLRFISQMAHSQVSAVERNQALAGARFAMERLRRELSQAYSPSVYISNNHAGFNQCLHFVPVLAAGVYTGEVKSANASFFMPLSLDLSLLADANMAVSALSAANNDTSVWQPYPGELPTNVVKLTPSLPTPIGESVSFAQLFTGSPFVHENPGRRYVMLLPERVSFCLKANGELWRERHTADTSKHESSLMLTGITSDAVFVEYKKISQLLTLDVTLATQDGDLVLSSQLQVNYEP